MIWCHVKLNCWRCGLCVLVCIGYILQLYNEICQHGLSPLSGGDRQPDHGGIQAETNGGREFIQGKTQRESGVRGVWGGTSGWIPVESHDDSTRESRTTATPLGPPDDWGAQDVQNEFSDERRQTKVPGGGMPGGVRDTSGDAGELRAPARPRHCGHIGGGQPPPTTVPPVRPAGLQ